MEFMTGDYKRKAKPAPNSFAPPPLSPSDPLRRSFLQYGARSASNSSVHIGRASQSSWRQRGDGARLSFAQLRAIQLYDFNEALAKRDNRGLTLAENEKRDISELIAKHEWASSHQVLNAYLDNGRSKLTTDKILEAVPDKEAVMNHWASSPRHRTQTLKTAEVVSTVELDKLRETVRDILARRDAARLDLKHNPGNRELAEEEEKLTQMAKDGRLYLVDSITKCWDFATEVDIHGLDPHLASCVVYQRLKKDNSQFVLITGQGHHSKNNISTIGEEVKLYMNANRISWDVDPFNLGRVRVEPRSAEVSSTIVEPKAAGPYRTTNTGPPDFTALGRVSSVRSSMARVSSFRSLVAPRRDSQRS